MKIINKINKIKQPNINVTGIGEEKLTTVLYFEDANQGNEAFRSVENSANIKEFMAMATKAFPPTKR